MPLQCVIDGVAGRLSTFEFTSNDPGGPETLTAQIQAGPAPRPGARVTVFDGVEPIWDGEVEEPGQRHEGARASANVTAVGRAVAFKRNPYSMVYIDRALSAWRGPSGTRRAALLAGSLLVGEAPAVIADSTGSPELHTAIVGAWSTNIASEAWYDAGPGNAISEVRSDFAISSNLLAGNLVGALELWELDGDTGGARQAGADLTTAASGSGTLTSDGAGPKRFAMCYLQYPVTGGQASMRYWIEWGNLRVIGDHGLTLRGSTAASEGVYATDVARHAAIRSRAGFQLEIAENGLTLPHLVYRDVVNPEQVIDDLAVLLGGWHWGVWPGGALEDTPRFVFAPPPTEATAMVRYDQVQELDLTEKLSAMFDEAIVNYTDAAGSPGQVEVAKTHPRLPAGLDQQLVIDAGAGSADYATALGTMTLAASQLQTRMAGSCRLPAMIQTTAGGPLPAHRLRPGRDRLQIAGIPTSGSLLEDGTGRLDAFRVKRLSVRVEKGEPRTTVEFDSGADLIETLQARVAAATASG
jgi:hypothetical protein